MTTKNYGPAVSGYLDPSGRNWENPVFQAGKPVLDKEINLVEDLSSGYGQAALRRSTPSGWISDDFTASSDMAAAIFTPSVVADQLSIPNDLKAHVNGWLLNISYTDSATSNDFILPAAPVGAGSKRTDLVILEVWRKLISASPSTDGKSPLGRIWLNGNVKINPADDAALNPADDILDVAVGAETTKRVQIQYRLRVISGVDLFAYPYGIDDPSVVANSVPPNAATPDGVATAFLYANQSAAGDAGLWVAGDGNPLNALNTVDGYMYAIPLMAVFRRNQTAFDRNTNHNGGVASPGPSDRPDGLFYDILDSKDIVDLRMGVSPVGWNYQEVLAKNLSYLLDNVIRTDWTTTTSGGGCDGHTVLTANEIGVLPGDGIITGDTPGGEFIGQFDNARRFFSDRPIYEIITVAISRSGGGNWLPGDTFTIDPTSLPIYPNAAFNWASRNPPEVMFLDVTAARWVGEAAGKVTTDALAYIVQVTGLGIQPIIAPTVTLDAVLPPGLTDERIFVDVLVAWPSGLGLTRTPTDTYESAPLWYTFALNNPGVFPPGFSVNNPVFDAPHREVQLQYTVVNTITQIAESPFLATYCILPERASDASPITILKNGLPIFTIPTLEPDGRRINLNGTTTIGTDILTITYRALRPYPEGGAQITLYFYSRAPQTAREALIGTTLTVIPRSVDSSIYSLTVGSGSEDTAYPYETAYVQMGGIFPTSVGTFNGDHELAAGAAIYTGEFNASTGMLKMPTYVGYTPNPQEAVFTRLAGDVDIEGRSYFPTVPVGTYVPNAYAQPLTDAKKHRNFLPMLAELTADSPLGFKGQLVLILLLREAEFDNQNNVVFDPDPTANTTVATVFRIKGNLLNKRA